MSHPHIIILAAGLGVRMHSAKPKVLHEIAGLPMLTRVINTALALKPEAIHVVYGHNGEQLRQAHAHLPLHWIFQKEQLGTGHAVLQALPHIPSGASVLILSADVPLIQVETLSELCAEAEKQQTLTLLVAKVPNPYGLGRIMRNAQGIITTIMEEKDATEEQRRIDEVYTGICCASATDLVRWLPQLSNQNAQGEYYFTQIIEMAVQEQQGIASIQSKHLYETQGVNNRLQLQQLERIWQQVQAEKLLLGGVTLADSARIDIRGELQASQDVFIDINCVFEGQVSLAEGCHIGPNCILKNVTIGKNTHVLANSLLEGAVIGEDCQIGPYARLRPGTQLENNCKIGNFVETKNAIFGANSKANHLSYLGDVHLGNHVNIGAGTITCNYDGANKHRTQINEGAFIGSGTQLVAPVTIGAQATIGAGSTIRADVPAEGLTLCPKPQKTILGWKRPQKENKK